MIKKAQGSDTTTTRRVAIKSPAHDATVHIWKNLTATINEYIAATPRTLQREIGPSGIGDPCDYCLGARLYGLREVDDGGNWLTLVGSAVHDTMEDDVLPGRPEWARAQRLYVGDIDGRRIEGTTDCSYIGDPFTVVDFKVVGKNTLEHVKFDAMKELYRAQVHVYGRGYELAGNAPEFVAVAFLPREERKVTRGYWWSEPYDRQVALDALARAERIAIDTRILGWPTMSAQLAKLDGCYNCKRWTEEG